MRTLYFLVSLSLFIGTTALAQTDEEEMASRIKNKVAEMGLKFTQSEAGTYRFTIGLDNNRSQLVFVSKSASVYLNTGYMRVYSIIMKFAGQEQIPKKTLINLMNDNGNYKLGWFELVSTDSGDSGVYFSHKIPLTATAVNLYALIVEVAKIADKTELTYTEKDEF